MENIQYQRAFVPRRRLFLSASFQGKLLWGIAAATLLSAVLLAVDYYVFFGRNVPTSPWDPEMVWIFLKANRPLIIQLVVFVTVLCFIAIVLTHRVAGPLYSLEKSIKIVQEGNLVHRARFRKKDELSHLRDAFNAMLEAVHGKVLKDRDAVAAARREIEPLLARPDLNAETKAQLERIKSHLESVTRGFTL